MNIMGWLFDIDTSTLIAFVAFVVGGESITL